MFYKKSSYYDNNISVDCSFCFFFLNIYLQIDSCKEINESEDFSLCGDESEPPSSNESCASSVNDDEMHCDEEIVNFLTENEAEKSQTNFEEENGTTRTR